MIDVRTCLASVKGADEDDLVPVLKDVLKLVLELPVG